MLHVKLPQTLLSPLYNLVGKKKKKKKSSENNQPDLLIPAMNLVHSASAFSTVRFFSPRHPSRTPPCRRFFAARLSLPFSNQEAKCYKELEAAVNVVERACRLCVDVRTSLFSSEGRILEKNDQTPVTVADFGVQALVSLELGKLFPSIPLVAEEDSAFLRANNLVGSVVSAVTDKTSFGDKSLTHSDVLEAIDRGGKAAFAFGVEPAIYWVLDPIDGTKGFVRGPEALYVVGLALVVDGEIILGVMGCPNWREDILYDSPKNMPSGSGIIMVAHRGYGTWKRRLSDMSSSAKILDSWTRCFVDGCCIVKEARFCIQDSQSWDLIPLSALFNATTDADNIRDKEILLVPTCCGSLCKYLMIASGRGSVYILRAIPPKIIKAWDHAAGLICVQEAGGRVTDWRGNQLDFAEDQVERRSIFPSGGVLATNGIVHDQIVEMISSHISI